ncbi:MAG: hypothetical protein DRP35_01210 [Candidatus Zixiibacteriota bacterium]|nr:MAG: hypothetical protein DRP35_01210 [candidate division Zixibacteria bacterium]
MQGRLRLNFTSFLLTFLLLVAIPGMVFAGPGQIKGKVTDESSGEAVIGASVFIVGTALGAQTDFNGEYIIRQVEPGTYVIRVTHIDYNSVDITEVDVKPDLSFDVSPKLKQKVSELDVKITVTAERDIIDKFEVSNQVNISKEEISHRPVTTVDELLGQVAGVVTNSSGDVFIRGGRAGEVAYYVDGVPIGDPLGGLGQAGAQLSLVSGSIQEFTIIKDGFDPEYGDALSGIVKITTRTGSKDNTNINFQYITDDFGNSSLNKYSRNSDYVRFSLSGPDPLFKSKVLPALGLNFLEDKEFTYYFYAEVDKNDGIYQYEDYDSPITERSYDAFNLLGIDIPDRRYNKYYWMANFKFRPRPNLKMIVSLKDSQTRWTLFNWEQRYSSALAPVQEEKWSSASLEISQTISKSMNYELLLSYKVNELNQKPGDPNNPGKGLDPDQFYLDSEWESWNDTIPNGIYDPPEPIINLFPDSTDGTPGNENYGAYTGPAYTWGEFNFDINRQSGLGSNFSEFRFNDNNIVDNLEGEPFIDLNGNGVWDRGEFLNDKNGNGVLDYDRLPNIDNINREPYIDGDSIIGEPFTDVNANNIYDRGIDIFIKSTGPDNMDFNHNGQYDGPTGDPAQDLLLPLRWTPGIPFVDRNGNGLYDPPNNRYDAGEPFVDVNGNGTFDGGSSEFLAPMNYYVNATWHKRKTETYRAEFKIYRQMGNHEVKSGFALQKNKFNYQEIVKPYLMYTGRPDSVGGISAPYPTRGAFRDMFAYDPLGGTFYLRDKIEYGSMIASLGFRWDFFLQDKYDLVEVAKNDDLGTGIILGDRQKFSPRIGFSYPISDKAKVHFNYGHFFQLPALNRMYSRNTSAINENDVLGNYNLDYQKTIQYSFGVKYAMSENYSVDFSGYFKDEFDKINSYQVQIGGLTRQQYRNSDYGRGRGIELTVEKRGGGYVNGMFSYTYAFAFGKASQTNENYLSDFELSRDPLSESALDNDVRHSLKSSIQVFIPSTVKPRLFGLPIPNGWSLSVETIIESGQPFTPSKDYPGIATTTGEDIQNNSLRRPTIVNFDIRFTKDFKLASLDYKFIVWIENVFDNHNVDYVYSNTGRPDTGQNINQMIIGGTEYDNNPSNWEYGRQIRVGLEINL